MNIVAISGSLRKKSFNTGLLRAAVAMSDSLGISIKQHEISEIPLFNTDVEDEGYPSSVQSLMSDVLKADGVIIVTPEYNQSIPGVLKNTLDWLSRDKVPLSGKPVGLMGVSDGMYSTVRAQQHLRLTLISHNAYVMPQPYMQVGTALKKFDANGNLQDEKTKEKLKIFLTAYASWVNRFI